MFDEGRVIIEIFMCYFRNYDGNDKLYLYVKQKQGFGCERGFYLICVFLPVI